MDVPAGLLAFCFHLAQAASCKCSCIPSIQNIARETMFGDQILETGQSAEITPLSIRIVKGYTKVQCIAFGLLLASDNDITPESEKVLEPFANILDKGWLLPVHAPWIHDLTYELVWPD